LGWGLPVSWGFLLAWRSLVSDVCQLSISTTKNTIKMNRNIFLKTNHHHQNSILSKKWNLAPFICPFFCFLAFHFIPTESTIAKGNKRNEEKTKRRKEEKKRKEERSPKPQAKVNKK